MIPFVCVVVRAGLYLFIAAVVYGLVGWASSRNGIPS